MPANDTADLLTRAPLRRTLAVNADGTPAAGGASSKLNTTTRLPLWATGQHVVVGAATAKTTAITGTEVMITLSTDAYIRIGTQATIAATKGAQSMFLPKGGPYTFQLATGEGVAVIQDTAAGIMSVVPVA